MTNWKHTIDIKDLWQNEEMPFEEKRDAIHARIVASVPYKRAVRFVDGDSDGDNYWDHESFVDDVADLLTVQDEDEFDDVWSSIYNYADDYQIWIAMVI